jgi:hypothetical protein
VLKGIHDPNENQPSPKKPRHGILAEDDVEPAKPQASTIPTDLRLCAVNTTGVNRMNSSSPILCSVNALVQLISSAIHAYGNRILSPDLLCIRHYINESQNSPAVITVSTSILDVLFEEFYSKDGKFAELQHQVQGSEVLRSSDVMQFVDNLWPFKFDNATAFTDFIDHNVLAKYHPIWNAIPGLISPRPKRTRSAVSIDELMDFCTPMLDALCIVDPKITVFPDPVGEFSKTLEKNVTELVLEDNTHTFLVHVGRAAEHGVYYHDRSGAASAEPFLPISLRGGTFLLQSFICTGSEFADSQNKDKMAIGHFVCYCRDPSPATAEAHENPKFFLFDDLSFSGNVKVGSKKLVTPPKEVSHSDFLNALRHRSIILAYRRIPTGYVSVYYLLVGWLVGWQI